MTVHTMSIASAPVHSGSGTRDKVGQSPRLWPGIKRLMFEERHSARFGRWEAVVLFLYSVILAVCAPRHESWFDEAQAWLIAKDSSLWDLVAHRLHYEGAPALWHLILWCAIRLGAPFGAIHAIAALIAIAGVFVWLRYSPLPRLLTWLMPFTYFLQYQYAVVARSYVLAPLFAYLLMRQYQRREGRGFAVALVAGLFANTSLHMAAFASGLALMWAVRHIRRETWIHDTVRLTPAAGLLLTFLLASVAVAVPTSDGSSTSANPVVVAVRNTVSGRDAANPGTAATSDQEPAKPFSMPPQKTKLGVMLWKAMTRQPSPERGLLGKFTDPKVLRHVLVFLTAATATISTSNLVAAIFALLLLTCLIRSKLLFALAPWILIQCCNVLVTGEAHHFGLLWVALTCCFWALALEPANRPSDRTLRQTLYSFLLVIVCVQIWWSAHAVYGDVVGPYSGDRQTAEYLASLPQSTRVAAFDDDSVTVNAFLGKTRYMNHHVDYWPFSRTTNPSLFEKVVMQTHPDAVNVKMTSPDHPVMDQWVKLDMPGSEYMDESLVSLLRSEGYHPTHQFCGHRFFRASAEATDCRVIFEPVSK